MVLVVFIALKLCALIFFALKRTPMARTHSHDVDGITIHGCSCSPDLPRAAVVRSRRASGANYDPLS